MRTTASNAVTVRRDSGPDAALFARATSAWESRQYDSILPELSQALSASADYRLWHMHGLMLRELQQREQALPSLRRAVELAPDAARPAHALARTLYEAGLPSIEAFGHALRLMPGNEEIVSELAMAFVGAGEVNTAIAGLEKIVARSPLWVAGHVKLSQLRWMEGGQQGFTRSFTEALRRYPQAIDLWRGQIVALMHAEQWDEALSVIAEGRVLLGNHPVFAINEAVIHAERGEISVADALFAPFVEVDDPALQIRLVRHHFRANRPEAAGKLIDKWLGRPEAFMFYPYASIAWRLTSPERWQWLEGDDRFVGVYDITERLPPLDELAATLRKLHKLSGHPLEQSVRGGTQTDGDIFMRIDPILVRLREAARATVAEHVARLPPPDPAHPLLGARRDRIAFAGAWSVRLRSAGFHSNHVHPLGWLSSALYVSLPPDIGVRDAGLLAFGEPRSSCFALDMAPFRMVTPKPGRLVLFPSYMWHGTRPFSEGERLTVAFDVARLS
jgi:Flp pilus assembly protein TadD